MGALASCIEHAASVPVVLVAARRRRRPRDDDDARAGRHRVRARPLGCPASTASTRPSCRCSPTRLFGPSRILVLGPDSALAAVILAVVLPLSAGDPQRAVAPAGVMAIVSGAVCMAAGLARLGFITELLSKPIRYGYMNGIALTVMLSQIPKLLGFSVEADGPVRQAAAIVERVLAGSTNVAALAIGASTLVLILVLKRWPRVPGMLIAVVAATVVVAVFDLATAFRRIRARSVAAGTAGAAPSADRCRRASYRSSWAGSRSPSFHSPTRACSLERMRRVCVPRSTRTRK